MTLPLLLALFTAQSPSGTFINVSTSESWLAITFNPATLIPSSFDVSDNVNDLAVSAEYQQQLNATIQFGTTDSISRYFVTSS